MRYWRSNVRLVVRKFEDLKCYDILGLFLSSKNNFEKQFLCKNIQFFEFRMYYISRSRIDNIERRNKLDKQDLIYF